MPMTLLLTRPEAQAQRFAAACKDRLGPSVGIVVSPILQIQQTGDVPDLTRYRGLILTSENGAHALGRRAQVAGLVAHCVGERTAAAAAGYGLQAQAAGGTALELVESVRHADGPLLHVRGVHARGDVAARLTAAGVQTDEAVLYDQIPCALNDAAQRALGRRDPVLLPLFSPRSAALVSDAVAGAAAPLYLGAMSGEVAAAWSGPEPRVHLVSERPDGAAMLDTVAHLAASALP